MRILAITGFILILAGATSVHEPNNSGVLLIFIGLGMVGYFGLGRTAGVVLAFVLALPIIGYLIAGDVGAFIGVALIAGLLAVGIVGHVRNAPKADCTVSASGKIIERHVPLQLVPALEAIHGLPSIERKQNESIQDYNWRCSVIGMGRRTPEYELEVVQGRIKCANDQVTEAELHRIVVYLNPAGAFAPPMQKRVVELKVSKLRGAPAKMAAGTAVQCIDNSCFPVSLKLMKTYQLLDGSVKVGNVYFLHVVDESGGPYFYQQTHFQIA